MRLAARAIAAVTPPLLAAILLLGAWGLPARAQTSPIKFLSTASTNSHVVFGRPARLNALVVVNTTTTLYYLKLYSKATAPVCGTDTPLWTLPVPFGGSNSGGGVGLPAGSLQFPLGLGMCLTSGIADNDTGNAATGVVINFGVTGY